MAVIRGIWQAFRPLPTFQRSATRAQPVDRRVDWERRRVIDKHREIQLRLKLLKQEAGLMGHWGHRSEDSEDHCG